MKIVLIRHGKHDKEIGNSSLLNEGKKQIKVLAKKFKKIKIEEIYSSDLKRAEETARILGGELKIPVIKTSVLREWKVETLRRSKKGWKKEDKKQFSRLKKFISEITKLRNEKNVIVMIVAHGLLNKLVMSILLDIDVRKMVSFMQDNSCVDIIEWSWHYKNWRLTLLNDTSHLKNNIDKLSSKYRR